MTGFLLDEYLDYLGLLGLTGIHDRDVSEKKLVEPQLRFLLGNIAAERILLHIYHHGGGHLRAIARDHDIGVGAAQRVLARLVRAGLLRKESRGRVVWYSFDESSPSLPPLLEVIRLVYENIPEEISKRVFAPRYRAEDWRPRSMWLEDEPN